MLLFTASFWETVVIVITSHASALGFCLFILTSYTMAAFLAVALLVFFCLHIWLIYNDSTTVEYCEKRRSGRGLAPVVSKVSFYTSLKNNLGKNPFLWAIPVGNSYSGFRDLDETGLSFNARTHSDADFRPQRVV